MMNTAIWFFVISNRLKYYNFIIHITEMYARADTDDVDVKQFSDVKKKKISMA